MYRMFLYPLTSPPSPLSFPFVTQPGHIRGLALPASAAAPPAAPAAPPLLAATFAAAGPATLPLSQQARTRPDAHTHACAYARSLCYPMDAFFRSR